jgi:glyoxylase-like metal-dependent hydrolase (beta-lactamase superfamily II)
MPEADIHEPREVAPGVHRIDFAIGAKPMAMYVLAGDWLTLVDTGIPTTPPAVYLPAIRAIGRRPDEVRLIVITHADADHIGGNSAARALFPNALLACHPLDERWAADPAVIMAERYDGFAAYGLRYDRATFDFLRGWMGAATPIDLLLTDGARIRLTDDDWLTGRHVPAPTPGHLALVNERRRYALIGDAVFGQTQLDPAGGRAAAPPYTDVAQYRATIAAIRSFAPDLLLTCHYPVMRGAAVGAFLDDSLIWCNRAEETVLRLLRESDGSLSLGEAIELADPELGPFAAPRELQWALRAHFEDAVAQGAAEAIVENGITRWRASRRPDS